ncbi:tetratricopeptide repeat protein [Celerinatantimonas yamalensis]|uniref:Tetratricopeptide repeat protein n=1 Tax=Celerinatantimonas yamalensis TaxID=559956 RepID=A0ABW9G5Y8_9GAMM
MRLSAYWIILFVGLYAPLGHSESISQSDYRTLQAAQALLAAQQPEKAQKKLQQWLQQLAKSPSNEYARSLAQITLGRTALALQNPQQALAAFKQAYQSQTQPEAQQQALLMTIAQLQLNLEQWQAGVDSLKQWLKVAPNTHHQANHYYLLAIGYYHLNDWHSGLDSINTALTQRANAPLDWYQLGVALAIAKKQWHRSIIWQQKIVSLAPSQMQNWYQLANLELNAKQPLQALATLRLAWQRHLFAMPDHYRMLSQLALSEHIPYLAAVVYADGIKKQQLKNNAENLQQLASLWTSAKQYPQALKSLDQLATRYPSNLHYQSYIDMLLAQKKWQRVMIIHQQANQHGQKSAALDLSAGIAATELNQFTKATALFHLAKRSSLLQSQAKAWLDYVQQIRTTQG